MIGARRATPADILNIQVREQQQRGPAATEFMCENFERLGESWTFTQPGGAILMVAGIIEVWPGRGTAWSMVADRRPWPAMMRAGAMLHRMLGERLESTYHRIESYADASPIEWWNTCDWWLRHLGFRPEGLLEQFTQDGRDQFIYARVRSNG